MIKIKAYGVPKKNGSSSVNTGRGSTSIITNSSQALADNWFYFNNDYNAVCCRYDFYSVGGITANGIIGEDGEDNTMIVDNLTSTYTDKALSANQGRVLKNLIDNIQTGSGGGGGVSNTVSWSNVTDKPSEFTPTAHTHTINDVSNLQNTLNTITSTANNASTVVNLHANNSSIHLSQSQINKLNSLTEAQFTKLASFLDMITVDSVNGIITVNGSINTTNDVSANV